MAELRCKAVLPAIDDASVAAATCPGVAGAKPSRRLLGADTLPSAASSPSTPPRSMEAAPSPRAATYLNVPALTV